MDRPFSTRLREIAHPAYRALERSAHVLRYLFIEITQRCNLACLHCGSDCGRTPRLAELSTDEWLAFFAYLRRTFDRRSLVLVVTGGEPFCCPSFDRLTASLGDHQLAWGMVSNGWAVTPQRLARALGHGLSGLTISLDGLEASHDWLRGRPGSFARAMGAIQAAVQARVPFFDVVTCVNPRNLDELPALLERLSAAGVKAWRLFTIFPKGRAKENPGLRLEASQLRRLFDWIAATRGALGPGDIRVQYSCEGYLPPEADRQVRDEPYFCRAGINIGSVLCDGSISACPNISRSFIQGNIRTDDFKTVWEERFRPHRSRTWTKQGACSACADWKRCQGNSMHLWDEEYGGSALCHSRVLAGHESQSGQGTQAGRHETSM